MTTATHNKRTTSKLVTMSQQDRAYLAATVATLKHSRPNTNDSKLVAVGIALLRQKSTRELEKFLHKLDTTP